ncbi:hypothetical protein [Lacinutrix sp.]|uniref:hypothetical protein n=1 Tax=Lacinutrix sp. TaxID=1937692 RepID=UPI0025C6B867|nr:hypothetical protein [Lacinutrix sp.]
MKKAIQKHLLLVAVLVTMVNYASNVSPLNEYIKKTVLTLNNVKEGQRLLIKDINQVILYKEKITKSGDYRKGFDLTELPNGDYYFELDKNIEIEVIPFTVIYNVVTFNNENKVKIFKPFVSAKDNTVVVSTLSLESNPVELSIYYENDGVMELIHNETVTNLINIQKAYVLDDSKKGTYLFSITTEKRTFTNYINL